MVAMTSLMAYSDYVILDAIKQLNLERGGFITHEQISEASTVPVMTVRRGVQRLVQAGRVQRARGGRKTGYVYEVIECPN